MRAKRRCMHGKRLKRSPIRNIRLNENTQKEPELIQYKPQDPKAGYLSTGGIGLLIDSAKKVFKGYGEMGKTETGRQIIKDSGVGRTRKI
jgi:hypothetical protein